MPQVPQVQHTSVTLLAGLHTAEPRRAHVSQLLRIKNIQSFAFCGPWEELQIFKCGPIRRKTSLEPTGTTFMPRNRGTRHSESALQALPVRICAQHHAQRRDSERLCIHCACARSLGERRPGVRARDGGPRVHRHSSKEGARSGRMPSRWSRVKLTPGERYGSTLTYNADVM